MVGLWSEVGTLRVRGVDRLGVLIVALGCSGR
jgi:hypothetical protein